MKVNLKKNLTAPKNEKLAQIDADADLALSSYRTSSEVAAIVYTRKRDEVARSATVASLDELPFLNAEAKALNISREDLLETWRQKVQQEDEFIISVEAIRQCLKTAVKQAQTPAEIDAIWWP